MADVQHPPVPAYEKAHIGLPSLDPESHDDSHTHVVADSANGGLPRGPVFAKMNFYQPPADGSNPHNFVEKPVDKPQRNFGEDTHEIQIQDARGHESQFELETHAFVTLQGHPHNEAIDWNDDESVKKHYYPEVEKLLLDPKFVPGTPRRVFLFDHTIRRANPNSPRGPVTRCHIDQTPKSAAMRVKRHFPEPAEYEELLKGRYRIINVWRPINGAVESDPLAFAASNTVPNGDMVPVEHRYPTWTGETAAVRYNPKHQWYYWSGIENDERILLQCFDSDKPMNRVPHSAFVDPRATSASKPRESIEVRALVLG